MADDVVICAEGLGKKYVIGQEAEPERYTALRDVLARGARNAWRKAADLAQGHALVAGGTSEEFWALKDVSFEVRRGEVLGIIGHNGAGKSTLLKILSRITEPSEGRVTIKGRVASLLEVGTGFHPELTGRENIYLNGAILGMTRAEIRRKFDEIVAFAEVEKFLDTPVKRYSSGMYVRLAFAVAAHLDPEILLVDEVLAVGDIKFQRKCLGKIGEQAKAGQTVLLVSHNMAAIRHMCKRVMLLSRGQKILDEEGDQTIQAYLELGQTQNSFAEIERLIADLPHDPTFRLRTVRIEQDGLATMTVISGRPIDVVIEYDVFEVAYGLHIYFLLYDTDEALLLESLHNGDSVEDPVTLPGRYVSRGRIPENFLAERTYYLRINAAIHCVRGCMPQPSPIIMTLKAMGVGAVNAAYPGYVTPGRIAPLFRWNTEKIID
jgi:lipopolysaccharide transport system ATP-binding protein